MLLFWNYSAMGRRSLRFNKPTDHNPRFKIYVDAHNTIFNLCLGIRSIELNSLLSLSSLYFQCSRCLRYFWLNDKTWNMFLVSSGDNFISTISTNNNNDVNNILLGEHLLSAMQFIFISLYKPKKKPKTLYCRWFYLHLKAKTKTKN